KPPPYSNAEYLVNSRKDGAVRLVFSKTEPASGGRKEGGCNYSISLRRGPVPLNCGRLPSGPLIAQAP
ncbi:hypothetical protein CDAR_599311, partial [Caerostris darwini]